MLALATATIDVHPPRARGIARRWPRLAGRFWSVRQWWANFSEKAARPINEALSRFEDTNFTLGAMLRTLVPGWAHRYRGNPQRGAIFFFGYLALLLPGLVFFGTGLGSLCVGLAFAVHIASAADALVGRFATLADRLAFMFACAIGISLAIYLPAAWFVTRVAVPIHINQQIFPFNAGDVLWYHRTSSVAPGDWVLYQVPAITTPNVGHRRYVFRNSWLSRVVGVAGQRVSVTGGQLLVDGKPCPFAQTSGVWGQMQLEAVVPEGQVFILPDGLFNNGAPVTPALWQQLGFISRSRIDGRIFFRSQPLWRISTIRGIEGS